MLWACDAAGLCDAGLGPAEPGLDLPRPPRAEAGPQGAPLADPVKPREVLPVDTEGEELLWAECMPEDTNGTVLPRGKTEEEHVDEIIQKCCSFHDPVLRRGMRLSMALAYFGYVFASSKGSAKTFEMSRPVEHLDCFISHNWVTERYVKFLALAYHFNSPFAAVVAAVMYVVAFCLEVFTLTERGTSWLACSLSFLLVLLFARRGGSAVFLDKTCIHQCDRRLQRQGIESLSAFLCISRELVIVYTEVYATKLWTVYELASMIILNPSARITIIPSCVVCGIFKYCLGLTVFVGAWVVVQSRLGDLATQLAYPLLTLFGAVLSMISMACLRYYAVKRVDFEKRIKTFQIRAAICTVESDRELVYRNVAAMMRARKLVPSEADQDTCLDTFDFIVRQEVPAYMREAWGCCGIAWRLHASVVALVFGLYFDGYKLEEMRRWFGTLGLAYYLSVMVSTGFAALPLSTAMLSKLASTCLELRGPSQYLLMLVLWLVHIGFQFVLLQGYFLSLYLVAGSVSLGWSLVFSMPCIGAACMAAVYWPYLSRWRRPEGDWRADLRARTLSSLSLSLPGLATESPAPRWL